MRLTEVFLNINFFIEELDFFKIKLENFKKQPEIKSSSTKG